jgi:hypothetical protein
MDLMVIYGYGVCACVCVWRHDKLIAMAVTCMGWAAEPNNAMGGDGCKLKGVRRSLAKISKGV